MRCQRSWCGLLLLLHACATYVLHQDALRGFVHQVRTDEAVPLCPPQPVPVALPSPLPRTVLDALARVEKVLEDSLNSLNVPSISAALRYRGEVLRSFNLGEADKEGAVPPTSDTIYRIGSVSKIFPVLQLHMMYHAKQLDSLDDPLSKYAPSFAMRTNGWEEPTLRQIAGQMGGLPREAPCDITLISCDLSNEEMLKRLEKSYLIKRPGSYPSYSNLGYSLLGRLLTGVVDPSGALTFERWVQEHVLDPLGMKSTGFNFTDAIRKRMATGYNADGSVAPLLDLGWAAPCGQMYSTANDLGTLASAIMNGNIPGIDANLGAQLLAPHFINRGGASLFGTPWEMLFLPDTGTLVRGKGGNINGFSAYLSLIPELNISFVAAWNGAVDEEGVARSVLDNLLAPLIDTLVDLQVPPPLNADPRFTGNFTLFFQETNTALEASVELVNATLVWPTCTGKVLLLRAPGINIGGALLVASTLNDHTLTVYLPDTMTACLTQELLAYNGEFVFFSADVSSFSLPGLVAGGEFRRE